MIEIKNVTKKYGNYVAVEDISFKVEESSIYGLVGYNGAGKTTLLKTAAGILKPESGEVLFDSQNVYDNGKVRSSLLYVPDEVYKDLYEAALGANGATGFRCGGSL